MNRRNFFKMFGGAVAAAMLPLGALALPERKWFRDVSFTSDMWMDVGEFQRRVLEPAMRRVAERIDNDIMRLYEHAN